ncbi:MAG: ATP synthase F1 subunit delta [Planctomycetota bacterium]
MAYNITLARRYARALLANEIDSGDLDEIEAGLYGVAEAYEGSDELKLFLGSPSFGRAQKKEAITKLFGEKINASTLRFLLVLIEKKRFSEVAGIAREFDLAADEAQGIAKVTVTSFRPLKAAQRKKLEAQLMAFTQRPKIVLDERVDETLLGGLKVQIGDDVLDGTVRGRLERLHEHVHFSDEELGRQARQIAHKTFADAQ